jgi:hypothetical protein
MHQQALHTSLLEPNDHSEATACIVNFHQELRREHPNPNHGEIGES